MSWKKSLKGKIVFESKHSKLPQKTMKFDLSPSSSPQLDDVLMPAFSNINLRPEEKRMLDRKRRMELWAFKDFDKEKMEECCEKFIKILNSFPEGEITIRAQDLGVYICLFSLQHRELLDNKSKISFQLDLVPFALFPKELFDSKLARKSSGPKHKLSLIKNDQREWLSDCKGLVEYPGHLDELLQNHFYSYQKVA